MSTTAPRSRFRPLAIATIALTTVLSATALSASAIELKLADDTQPLDTALTIGDTLWVGLENAAPRATYQVVLVDEQLKTLRHETLAADLNGIAAATPLFAKGGVVGCDIGAVVDAEQARFVSYKDAEAALNSRIWGIAVLDVRGQLLISRALSLQVTTAPRFFTSDAVGCPREVFAEHETVFLTGMRTEAIETIGLFLVADQENWSLGATLSEARVQYQGQAQTTPVAAEDFTSTVWVLPEEGLYDVIVRPNADPLSRPKLMPGDLILPFVRGLLIHNSDCPRCVDPPGGKLDR